MNALKYKIFVYGTLKRGEPNHEELLTRNAKFVAQAKTMDKWPLIIASECNLPFLLNKKNFGKVFYLKRNSLCFLYNDLSKYIFVCSIYSARFT